VKPTRSKPAGPAVRRRRLEPFSQRARRTLLRLLGGEVKDQRVYRVDIGTLRLKQIVFARAAIAERLEAILARLRDAHVAPAPVARYGPELWLEFLEGAPVPADPVPVEELARIFATLYREAPRQWGPAERDFAGEVARDLDFLHAAGAIDGARHAALRDRTEKWCPGAVWVGHDYSDPRPPNFLRLANGELRVIDVESLQDEAPLGAGAVRAALRWPGLSRDALFSRLASLGALPFEPYVDFVELWFVTHWTKRCLLQGKHRLVNPRLFADLAERP
jgi:hypothetical protein